MTFKELKKEYKGERKLVEVKDKKTARSFFNSKASSSWGNGPIKNTDWTVIATPSRRIKEQPLVAFVCKTNLLHD